MSKYYPIDCNFYDELLQIITKKQKVWIDYQDENRKFYKIEALPIDAVTKDKAEFLILEDGQEIRMDYLHKVGSAVATNVLDRGNSCAG